MTGKTRDKAPMAWARGAPTAALIGLLACRSVAPPVPVPVASPTPAAVLAAGPEVPHNTLRWKTNDVSNFGYDIFRAESEGGPFVKINDRPVPGTLKPGKVQTFEYEDHAIDPRKDYWYYVESITLSGERVRFTPTLKAPAKVPIRVLRERKRAATRCEGRRSAEEGYADELSVSAGASGCRS